MSRSKQALGKLLVCVLCGAVLAGSGNDSYLAGLDALEQGEWGAAVQAMDKAVAANDDNPDYHLVRGVAYLFAEKLDAAKKDLLRAYHLRPTDRVTKMWLASATAMGGDLFHDTKYFPAATRDPFETAVREMSHRYGDPAFRAQTLHEPDPDADKKRAAERARFPTLAREFVERFKPKGAHLGGSLKARGIARYKKGRYDLALADLTAAHEGSPDDLETLYYLAGCKLYFGGFEGARADYTRCLTGNISWTAAYLGRALARASLGAAAGARSDLAIAKRLDPKAAARYEKEIQRRIAAAPPPADKSGLLQALFDAALAKGTQASLDKQALALARSVEATRLRADETYQEGLRKRMEAAAAEPRNAARQADLGAFLYDNAVTILTEWVEPRGKPKTYRVQTDQSRARELARAEKALDAALALDANQPKALAFKAACLMERSDWSRADDLLTHALQVAPTDADVLDRVTRACDHAAMVKAAQAQNLRSVKTWSDWYYIYYRYPSQQELAEADQLSRQADRLWALAEKSLKQAAVTEKGKPRGEYYSALLAERTGGFDAARTDLETAVRLDPAFLHAWRELATLCGKAGRKDEMYDAQFHAANLLQTTAGPLLKPAWLAISRTAFGAAGKWLDRAAATDPADFRVAAYKGVIAEEQGKKKDAAAWFGAAIAVQNAAERLRGVALVQTPHVALSAEEAAPALELAYRRGRLLLAEDEPVAAAACLAAASPLVERVEQAQRYRRIPCGMLPQVLDNPIDVPEAPNVETLGAWVRLRLGDALTRLGKLDAAAQLYAWDVDFEKRKPSVLDVGTLIREPAMLALGHLALLQIAKKDYETARHTAMQLGHPRTFSPASLAELERLRKEIDDALAKAPDPNANSSQTDLMRRGLLAQKKQLQDRKKALESRLAAPDASVYEKHQLQNQVVQVDRLIAGIDQQLAQLGSGR